MENNLESNSFKRSVWWKIYFFFSAAVTTLGIVSLFTVPKVGISGYILWVIAFTAMVGLFGFVFLKPIYKPKFWLLVLIADIVMTVAYYFVTNVDLRMGESDTVYYTANAFGWLLSLPGYYALYAYSKSSDPAWRGI